MEPGRPHRCLMESSWNERSPGLVASQWNHPWEVSSVSSYLKWGQYFLSGIIAIRTWHIHNQFSSFQSLSCVWLFMTPWTIARQASLSITNSRSLPKPMSIELVMPSNHLILCRPLLLLPSIIPSIMVFSNESALHIRCPSIGVSASISLLPMNTQDGSPLGWTGWISLQSKELSRIFSNTTVQNHQFFGTQLSL